ncbi:hypothetical protein V6N00_12650 [Tersicoccus sp. MR15.9]|uniref:hypothetical protein n=1 Tax=Tersicoccus mangrovi TaxID=3121635 RepID=UPI002FE56DA6
MTTPTMTRTVLTVDPGTLNQALRAVLLVGDNHRVPEDRRAFRVLVQNDALVIEATDGTVFIRTFTPITEPAGVVMEPVMIGTWAVRMTDLVRVLDKGTPTIALPSPEHPEVTFGCGIHEASEPVIEPDPRFAALAESVPLVITPDEKAPAVTALTPAVLQLLADLGAENPYGQPFLLGRQRRMGDPLVFTQAASSFDSRPWLVGLAGMNRTRRHVLNTVR